MEISKCWGKAFVVAGCLGLMATSARAGYDENVGAATDSRSSNTNGSMTSDSMRMSRSEMRMKNAQMLIQTLSEEKTEIAQLTAQRAAFLRMGGSENAQIARMWARWIREHKAAGPGLMRLIRANGGDPMDAKVLKAPVLGGKMQMLMATHKDHQAAVMTSQMRHNMTMSMAVKTAMHKRANLARKHLRQMMPLHDMMMKNGMMKGDMKMGADSSQSDTSQIDMSQTEMSAPAESSSTTTTTETTTTESTMAPEASATATPDASTTTQSTTTTESTTAEGTTTESTTSGTVTTGDTVADGMNNG